MPLMRTPVDHHASAASATSAPMIAIRQRSTKSAAEAAPAPPAVVARRRSITKPWPIGALARPGEAGGEPRLAGVGRVDPERADSRGLRGLGDGQGRPSGMEDVRQLGR